MPRKGTSFSIEINSKSIKFDEIDKMYDELEEFVKRHMGQAFKNYEITTLIR